MRHKLRTELHNIKTKIKLISTNGKGVCHSVANQDSAFQEEEMPEVEIDIDDLLEVNSDDERASKLQVGPRDRL